MPLEMTSDLATNSHVLTRSIDPPNRIPKYNHELLCNTCSMVMRAVLPIIAVVPVARVLAHCGILVARSLQVNVLHLHKSIAECKTHVW